MLESDPAAVLVDVRTDAEWSFVGVPDLSELGRGPICIAWQRYPDMSVNPHFIEEVAARGVEPDNTVVLLCRSGQRSRAAAEALTAQGYRHCYNITDGFEGVPDRLRHRGRVSGWKAAGLPWVQG